MSRYNKSPNSQLNEVELSINNFHICTYPYSGRVVLEKKNIEVLEKKSRVTAHWRQLEVGIYKCARSDMVGKILAN